MDSKELKSEIEHRLTMKKGVNDYMPRLVPVLLVVAMSAARGSVGFAQEIPDLTKDTSRATTDSGSLSTDPIGQPFQMTDDPSTAADVGDMARRSLKSPTFFSSPTGTLLKSVAFPGWGQWSNGKKQKAAVYFGIESYWITKALIWRHRARSADDLAEFAHARDRRNYFYWLTGITVFVSMFDAYADRYLLTMERTRNMPDEFWGDINFPLPGDEWRLALAIKF
jgi:hypothetical protein